jgi:hypothetical protein
MGRDDKLIRIRDTNIEKKDVKSARMAYRLDTEWRDRAGLNGLAVKSPKGIGNYHS